MKGFSQTFHIHCQNDHTAHNIDQRHKGHDLFRNPGDTVDSSQKDHRRNHRNYNAHNIRFYSKGRIKRAADRIRLYHIPHESQGQDNGHGEKAGKEFSKFSLKEILYVVDRSPYNSSVFFFPGILSHNCFPVNGCHSEKSADPHPEDSSWTA